jgi:type I restriction enzyme M protein
VSESNYALNPGRYVGATEEEEDGIQFAERIVSLRARLAQHFQQGHALQAQIEASLGELEV